MKKYLLLLLLAPGAAIAAAPVVTCPNPFYTMVEIPGLDVVNDTASCPSGYIALVDTTTSCLTLASSTTEPNCTMFAPSGVSYTDGPGTYTYTSPCILK